MSTVPSWAVPSSEERSEDRRAAIPHLREVTREELDRQEIEAAVISAKADARGNPVDGAWHRFRAQRCSRDVGLPQGVVVSAVREWLAKRGLDGVFDSKELEAWVGEWRNGGGRRSQIRGIADLRTEFGGDDGVL